MNNIENIYLIVSEVFFLLFSFYLIFLAANIPLRYFNKKRLLSLHIVSGVLINVLCILVISKRLLNIQMYPSFPENVLMMLAGFGLFFGGISLARKMPSEDVASIRAMQVNLYFVLLNSIAIFLFLFYNEKYCGYYLGLLSLFVISIITCAESLIEIKHVAYRIFFLNNETTTKLSHKKETSSLRYILVDLWIKNFSTATSFRGFYPHLFFVIIGLLASVITLLAGFLILQGGYEDFLKFVTTDNYADLILYTNFIANWSIAASGFLITIVVARGLHSILIGVIVSVIINIYPLLISFFIAGKIYLKFFQYYL